MPFSMLGSDASSAVRACLLCGTLGMVLSAAPAAAEWHSVVEVRVSGGNESDLVLALDSTQTVTPGGSFVEVAPAVSFRRWVGSRALVDLGTFAAAQRFMNDESRLVYAQTVYATGVQDMGGLRVRASTTLDYLDDSKIDTARRLGLGGELGIGLVRSSWSAEIWGGGGTRTYPNLDVLERMNRTAAYGEKTWDVGTTLGLSAGSRANLRVEGIRLGTDATDPLFDSDSWVVSADLNAGPARFLVVTTRAAYQKRTFANRPQGRDGDEYWQTGLGLRFALSAGWAVAARWGYSEYTSPDGTDEYSHRLVLGLTRSWGRPEVALLPPVDTEALARASGGSIQKPGVNGMVCFRILAAGAARVAVAGSFNAWDAEALALEPVGNGWWQGCVTLEPGTYQYSYVIDGTWTAPPEAEAFVDDGFGGRNGLLEVLPTDP